MINYVLLAFGIFAILGAIMFIFFDRVKGEDIYFDMDVKEQEIKKVIEDADEIISELNYTSEMVVKEIEEKLTGLREELRNLNNTALYVPIEKKDNPPAIPTIIPTIIPTVIPTGKKKKVTNDDMEKNKTSKDVFSAKQQSVFDYANQGMSVTDIAKQMNIGQGEVMLILSLKNEVE